jgi:hypothetical protein
MLKEDTYVRPRPELTEDIIMNYDRTKPAAWVKNHPPDNPLYTFKNLVLDLEPYTLMPRDDLSTLLKLSFQLILWNVMMGKKVQITRFGEFERCRVRPILMYMTSRNRFSWVKSKYVMRFTSLPYTKWCMGEYNYRNQGSELCAKYRMFIRKALAELWYAREKYPMEEIVPDFRSEKERQKFLHLCSVPRRKFAKLC